MSLAKTIVLSTALLIGNAAVCQETIRQGTATASKTQQPTSEEEYNYLTRGYSVQVANGLDMKKGYSFQDLGDWSMSFSDGQRDTQFKGLFRDGETAPCAILLMYKKTGGDKTYICIPSVDADPELWQRTMNQIHTAASAFNSSGMDTAIILGLMRLTAKDMAR